MIAALMLGDYKISIAKILDVLNLKIFDIPVAGISKMDQTVIFEIRMPRILTAVIVGFALSNAGAIYQACFKNPLVEPFILGASSGAALGFDLALWHESIRAVGPGISTLLNSLQIFFLAAVGFFFFGEKLSRLQTANLFLAAAGVAMIAAPEFGRNAGAAWGFASGIASGAMLALSMACVRKTHQAEPTALFPLMFLVSAGGVLALSAPAILADAQRFFPATPRDIALILVYGIVMQCFAWGLIAYAIPLLSLSLTGLLLLSEPVAALAIDCLLLGKPITTVQWCGAALTLLAIYLGSSKSGAY